MPINPLAPTLGGILKIGDTPRTPAREDPLHTLTDIVIPAKAGIHRSRRVGCAHRSGICDGFNGV